MRAFFMSSWALYGFDPRRRDERLIRVLEDPDELRRAGLADARLRLDPVLRAGERRLPPLGRALLALVAVRVDLLVDLDGDVLLVVLEGVMADDRDEDLRCSRPRELRVVLRRGAMRVVVRTCGPRDVTPLRPDCAPCRTCGMVMRLDGVRDLRSGWARVLGCGRALGDRRGDTRGATRYSVTRRVGVARRLEAWAPEADDGRRSGASRVLVPGVRRAGAAAATSLPPDRRDVRRLGGDRSSLRGL